MFPFLLYLTAGVVTAVHVYILLSMGVFGVPRNVLELISFLGSLCLVGSAYLSLFRPRFAAKIALLASLGIWSFYAPAIAATVKAGRFSQLSALRVMVLPCLALGFLVLVTIYSAIVSFRTGKQAGSGTWFFPERAPRSGRIAAAIVACILAVGFSAWVTVGVHTSRRPSSKFLIPDGYVGWVRVEFQVADAPPVPVERDQYIFRIPPTGILKTSSPEKFGYGKDEYYYDSTRGLRKLPTEAKNGRLVWGQINGEAVGVSGRRQYEGFFVGTEDQFKDWPEQRPYRGQL